MTPDKLIHGKLYVDFGRPGATIYFLQYVGIDEQFLYGTYSFKYSYYDLEMHDCSRVEYPVEDLETVYELPEILIRFLSGRKKDGYG